MVKMNQYQKQYIGLLRNNENESAPTKGLFNNHLYLLLRNGYILPNVYIPATGVKIRPSGSKAEEHTSQVVFKKPIDVNELKIFSARIAREKYHQENQKKMDQLRTPWSFFGVFGR
ncbi:MAG: hypothetical protein ACP5MX_01655 [Candidatus Micrarchaeia archaeon]